MSISRHSPCPQTDFGRGPNWLHESPFLPLLWEQTQDLGAPSLKHAAMKKALMDQSALKPELFAQIPWHVARYLWECLGRCDKQTLYMWKIMAETYPHQFRSVSEYYFLSVTLPKEPLKCYIDLMSSDTGSWRAILSMPTAHATPADLVAIGNLKNLVALDLYPAPTRSSVPKDFDEGKGQGLEDRIVRSWLEMAVASGSLQQLRLLRLFKQPRLTIKALSMLEKLPNLCHIMVLDCDAFYPAVPNLCNNQEGGVRLGGWVVRKLHGMPTPAGNSLLDAYRGVLELDTESRSEDHKADDPILGSDIPILQFGLSSKLRAEFSVPRSLILTRAPQKMNRKRAPSRLETFHGKGKRIMKDRGGRDMADVLSDFL